MFTASVWFMVDNADEWDNKKPFLWDIWKGSIRVWWHDTAIEETGKTVKSGEWIYIWYTCTIQDKGQGCDTMDIALSLFESGSVHYKQPKLERGANPHPIWTPNPDDAFIEIDALNERITKLENKIGG